jgi:Xaa-Pro aminopeptidase
MTARTGEAPVILGSRLEEENIERTLWAGEFVTYGDEADVWLAALDLLRQQLSKDGQLRLGCEVAHLTLPMARYLSDEVGAELVEIGDVLADLRLYKSPEELALLRLAGQIARIGATEFTRCISPGVTELSIASHAVLAMNEATAALDPRLPTSSYAYCHAGIHTLSPHQHPTGTLIRRDEVIALNVFAVLAGYCVELERTYAIGDPGEKAQHAIAVVGEAFEVGRSALVSGTPAGDVHRAASNVLKKHDLGQFIRHGTGHAHGIMIGATSREEGGELRSYNTRAVAPGMAFSVEPGLYFPGEFGVRHSDVFLIGNEGVELITEFPLAPAL